ncbi:MAG: substrate-binding domain-containing protein [Fusicatenibacter saccharivorans]
MRTQKRGLLSLEPRHQQLLRTRRRLLQSAPCKRYQHLASICPPGFPTSDEGYRDMLRLLESKAPIADAYFADNDIIAAAAMRALRENGYRIPEDVSIIGFDDVPMCDMMVPPLSTMKVRKRELGATAVQRLLDRVADPKRECLKMCMATKLVKRQSVSRR